MCSKSLTGERADATFQVETVINVKRNRLTIWSLANARPLQEDIAVELLELLSLYVDMLMARFGLLESSP